MRCGRRQRFRCDKRWLPIFGWKLANNVVRVEANARMNRLAPQWPKRERAPKTLPFVRLSSHVTFAPFFLLCWFIFFFVRFLCRINVLRVHSFALSFFFCRVVSQRSPADSQWLDCSLHSIYRPSHTLLLPSTWRDLCDFIFLSLVSIYLEMVLNFVCIVFQCVDATACANYPQWFGLLLSSK